MDLQQLIYAVETSKTGSINKAARNLYVSQPNISKAIANLEEELDFSLFVRTPKGVIMTEEGGIFLQHAQAMLTQFNEMKGRYVGKKNVMQIVKLATNRIPVVSETLVEICNELFNEKERISVALRETSSQEIYSALTSGEVNLAVVSFSQASAKTWVDFLQMQNIEVIHLYKNKVYIQLRENHPLLSTPDITFEELQKYPLIQVFEESAPPNFSAEIEMLRYKEFPKLVHVKSTGMISGFLSATDAIYFTTSYLAHRPPSYPNTTAIPLPDFFPEMSWDFFVLKLKSTRLSPAESLFVRRLKAIFNPRQSVVAS